MKVVAGPLQVSDIQCSKRVRTDQGPEWLHQIFPLQHLPGGICEEILRQVSCHDSTPGRYLGQTSLHFNHVSLLLVCFDFLGSEIQVSKVPHNEIH